MIRGTVINIKEVGRDVERLGFSCSSSSSSTVILGSSMETAMRGYMHALDPVVHCKSSKT